MKIDIFGAVFLDRYIYEGNEGIQIKETLGGSGLNIALGLHLLGHDVKFYGNIGNDQNQINLLKQLNSYGLSTENICIKDGVTGLFIAKNDEVNSVARGVNSETLTIDRNSLRGEYAVITTELNKDSLKQIVSYKWRQIFLDVGPRPNIITDISLPENIIKIGNQKENKIIPCHVKKLGPKGANWGDTRVLGSNELLPYTIGAGDLFDTLLIDGFLRGKGKDEMLKLAVELAEESCKIPGGFKIMNVIDEYKKALFI